MRTHRTIVALLVIALTAGACGADADDTAADRPPVPVSGEAGTDGSAGGAGAVTGSAGGTTATGGAALDASADALAPGRAAPQGLQREEPQDVTFRDYGVNPWVATAEDALSTFAMDVDTASYTLARAWIESGTMPRREAVRPEEFVNRFDYGYPQPDGTWGIHVDGGDGPWLDDAGRPARLVRVGLQARRVVDRPPVTLTFVIDTSGSMGMDNRLGLVQRSLTKLVQRLRPDDRIAIVEYDTEARTVLNPTVVAEPEPIASAIQRLHADGSTFAEGGLFLGYRMARNAFDPDGLNTVVLASDGVANVGQTGPDEILARVRDEADEGITLLALGVGMGNFNDVLLERLANDGDGTYFYIDSDDEADRLFGERLISTLMPIAAEAKVQVEFDPATVTAYRLVGYENRDVADEDFRNDQVDAGEVGAGHTVTAIYEIELAPGAPAEATALTSHIRWADPSSGEVREQERVATVADISAADGDGFALAATAAGFAEVLRASEHVAGTTLDQVSAWAREHLDGDAPDTAELLDLIDRAARLAG